MVMEYGVKIFGGGLFIMSPDHLAEDNKCKFLYYMLGLSQGIAAMLFSKDIRCTGQAQMS